MNSLLAPWRRCGVKRDGKTLSTHIISPTLDYIGSLFPPEYISELLNKPKYTRNLRSQSQHLLSVPKSRTVTYGDRAFSVCAPKLWNELPFQLRMSSNIQAFKSGLKTNAF